MTPIQCFDILAYLSDEELARIDVHKYDRHPLEQAIGYDYAVRLFRRGVDALLLGYFDYYWRDNRIWYDNINDWAETHEKLLADDFDDLIDIGSGTWVKERYVPDSIRWKRPRRAAS